MKKLTLFFIVAIVAMVLCLPLLAAETPSAESAGPDEAKVKAYLEKMAPGDTGSCLVENMNMQIVGISDLVEYKLRCNRGSESKSGQGVLRAARLRDCNWIDREIFALIAK
ncbi:MAG: hypothetical protein WAJ95_06050 [Desulfobacterales bacterium]